MIKEIKNSIVYKFKKTFYNLGFKIERIPNENKLFTELINSHEAIVEHELRKITSDIKVLDNHKFYNKILKRFVGNWIYNFTSEEFIGDGVGESNLCVYRRVGFEGNYYFEKVYLNNSYDLLTVEWFYEHIYPILKEYFNTPKLFKIIKGDLITIVYFEFIDLVSLPRNEWHPVFFKISKKMYKLSKDIAKLVEVAPNCVKDYKLHDYYRMTIKSAENIIEELSNRALTTQMIERVINLQPLILSHGDIHDRNVFANNYIIDWDSFGFFPQGFEVAIIYANNIESITFESLQVRLIEEYKDVVPTDYWDGFELSFLYFYLLLTAIKKESESQTNLQIDILNRVKGLYFMTMINA